jgi:hypothetical protein
MESKHLSLPAEKGYDQAYVLSYKLASERLAQTPDIEEQCRRSGAECRLVNSKRTIRIAYLNRTYMISLPDVRVSLVSSAEEVSIRDKLLILHYFNTAKGTPPTNRLVTFHELPEGTVYFPTFSKRTIKPLLDNFSQCPERLLDVSRGLGGRKTEYGDVSVTIDAFSRVPITIVLWRGDEELPPQGNVLFDANISDYLPTEDITVLCETITWKLVRFR